MKTGSPAAMRELNRNIIYQEFFRTPRLSRADLCRLTNLKAPTVSTIIQELCDLGKLVSCGKGDSNPNGGPLPTLYRINTSGCCFAGLDISYEGITGILMDEDLQLCYQTQCPISGKALEEPLTQIISALDDHAKNASCTIKTLGISASGMVDHEVGCISLSSISELDRFSFKPLVQKHLHIDPYVDNDINILLTNVLSEASEPGLGKSILCFGMRRYGVGMSIATNGQLYRGNHNISGNLQLFSGRRSLVDVTTQVCRTLPGWEEIPNEERVPHLLKALQTQDSAVIATVKEALHDMCTCIAALQSVFDTESIAICCELFQICPELFEYMQTNCTDLFSGPCKETSFLTYPVANSDFAEYAAKCAFRHNFQL